MFLNYEKTKLQLHAILSYIVRNNSKLFSNNTKNLNNIIILYYTYVIHIILYHFTDEEASLSSSNVETHCMNILNIENIVLDMTTFNERDERNTEHNIGSVHKSVAKIE